jgi:N-methylhydantoinase A
MTLDEPDLGSLNSLLLEMQQEAEAVVRAGAQTAELIERRVAFMRYHGQGHEIEVELPTHELTMHDLVDVQTVFEAEYQRIFSRVVPGMTIEILNWGLTVSTPSVLSGSPPRAEANGLATSVSTRTIHCDVTGKLCDAPVYDRVQLQPGDRITGPALIVEPQTTTLVSRDFRAAIDGSGNILLSKIKEPVS